MDTLDLNLLVALDALLAEGSVTGAARRLGLSASAASRTLTRLRAATGDPLLVRAGRGLVPTPHAAALKARVAVLLRDAEMVFRPAAERVDPAGLDIAFTLRCSESFMDALAPRLVAAVAAAASRVRLRFVARTDKDLRHLRDGEVDLEIGAGGERAPEVRTQTLFRDAYVGVARPGHPWLGVATPTPEAFAACGHVVASHRGDSGGPLDARLAALGLQRRVAVVVPGFPAAMRIAASTDLLAVVPRSSLQGAGAAALRDFPLPVALPGIAVAAMWHPRMDADPAHRWLRGTVGAVCRAVPRPGPEPKRNDHALAVRAHPS